MMMHKHSMHIMMGYYTNSCKILWLCMSKVHFYELSDPWGIEFSLTIWQPSWLACRWVIWCIYVCVWQLHLKLSHKNIPQK